MFEIDEQNLPFVRTRSALLVLDLQNDFVATGGLLPVERPSDFIERITTLLPHFREAGNVIWIRSLFEASRAVNSLHSDSETVITNNEIPLGSRDKDEEQQTRPGPSQKLLERHGKIAEINGRGSETSSLLADEDADDSGDDSIQETFLTVDPGKKPRLVLPVSPGSNFSQAARLGMNGDKDLIFHKSYYSAFKDGTLVQTLRAKFVTEIYLCGVLTNISVFATAMDAARHGYAITILDDCLGYRSKARHDEALRQLTEFTGCDIISSVDLIRDLQHRAKANRPTPPRNPRPKQRDSNIESLMANLNLKPDGSSAPKSKSAPMGADVVVAEASGTSESLLSAEELKLPTKSSEAEGKKRERVKTKIKARRRHSKSGPKDIGVAGEPGGPSRVEKGSLSPTSATLHAASQALEKIPIAAATEDLPSTTAAKGKLIDNPENIDLGRPTASAMTVTMKEGKSSGTEPEDTEAALESSDPPLEKENHALEHTPFPICEGDTTVIENLLDNERSDGIFERIRDEVRWQKMSHQGGEVPRLVAVQGEVAEDGSIPIYRHPADESPPLLPFSPSVSLIQAQVEEKLGHPVNHVLIQFYRDGTDYISEHSDKTLDIVPNTFIANVSLGAQRTMVFRTKKPLKNAKAPPHSEDVKPRQAYRASLPHNSMCKMGLVTNMRWLHAIRQDKRMASEKSAAELAYNGGRISLTFRLIGTFLDKDQQKIWGQGAVHKKKEDARTVINGETPESEKMIRAFGKENHSSEFDWKETYGEGFDVLHISNTPKLFFSGDVVADTRVKILLAEYDVAWTEGKLSPSFNWKDGSSSSNAPPVPESLPVKFVDNDLSKSTVVGDLAIMLYLDAVYGRNSEVTPKSQVDLARQFTRFQQCGDLLKKWRAVPFSVKPFRRELELWDALATEAPFIAGSAISLADYALWPILEEIAGEWGDCTGAENLGAYYKRLKERDSVVKALDHKGAVVDQKVS